MFNIVMFGPPGSGKGTQSKHIAIKYKLAHLSTGDVLRAECESGSDLGKQISALIDNGNFVPDDMIQRMVKKFILSNTGTKGFILDGFPRTINQIEWLDNMLAEIGEEVSVFLSLDVEEEELKNRILKRGNYSQREDDQNVDIIKTRIGVYHDKTKPVIDYYRNQNKYFEIDGGSSQQDVFNEACVVLDEIKKSRK